MHVSLTPELEELVSTKVQSGRYNSASEVVREALRLLEERDSARAAQLADFNGELGRRLASLDRGETVNPAYVRARFQRKSGERRHVRERCYGRSERTSSSTALDAALSRSWR